MALINIQTLQSDAVPRIYISRCVIGADESEPRVRAANLSRSTCARQRVTSYSPRARVTSYISIRPIGSTFRSKFPADQQVETIEHRFREQSRPHPQWTDGSVIILSATGGMYWSLFGGRDSTEAAIELASKSEFVPLQPHSRVYIYTYK